jgi:hypothetical protein
MVTMTMNKQEIAEGVLGHIEWQSPTHGLCQCPGEGRHQHGTGMRDCRVSLDGIATVHCFHRSCEEEVRAANKELRRRLWNDRWSLRLPGGGSIEGLRSNRGPIGTGPVAVSGASGVEDWRERLPGILAAYAWSVEEMAASSPQRIDPSAWGQFGQWLGLWEDTDVVWIGDVKDSGFPRHARHFRTAAAWRWVGPVAGNFTCGCAFARGSYARTKETAVARKYLVVESDELTKDEMGAVFRFMRERLGYPLAAVVDTGGKSLHGWFGAPRRPEAEAALKRCLTGLRCDPRMFSYTQPARVPGAHRGERLQRLIYCI